MAKPKRTPTAAEKALEAAKANIEKLETAAEKTGAAKDKDALSKAVAELPALKLAVNVERFKRVAGTRLNAAVKAIKSLTDCANKASYSYNQEQLDKIVSNLETATASVKETLTVNLNATGTSGKAKGTVIEL